MAHPSICRVNRSIYVPKGTTEARAAGLRKAHRQLAALFPIDRVHDPDLVRFQRHEQGRDADAAAEEADAAQEVAVDNAAGAEDDVVSVRFVFLRSCNSHAAQKFCCAM